MRCLERKKERQGNTTQQTKQHNTTRPRQLFFKEKTASGGIRTHDRPLARRSSYQLSCLAQLAGLESHIQYKATKATQASQTR